jgi:hypothetical protein
MVAWGDPGERPAPPEETPVSTLITVAADDARHSVRPMTLALMAVIGLGRPGREPGSHRTDVTGWGECSAWC